MFLRFSLDVARFLSACFLAMKISIPHSPVADSYMQCCVLSHSLALSAPTIHIAVPAAMPERLQRGWNVPPLQRHLLLLATPGGRRLLLALLFVGVQLSLRGVHRGRLHVMQKRLLRGLCWWRSGLPSMQSLRSPLHRVSIGHGARPR